MGRSRQPHLLPLFRSDAQARILATVFLAPEDEPSHVRAIAQRTGLPYSTVQREVSRLEDAGLVQSTHVGRSRVVAADRASPYFEELRSLLLKSYGPATLFAEALRGRKGVHAAFVYGSWASRYLGEPGSDPRDVDVVVIVDAEADRGRIDDDLATASEQLGRQVNPVLIDQMDWDAAADTFVRTVRSRPLVEIPLFKERDVDR